MSKKSQSVAQGRVAAGSVSAADLVRVRRDQLDVGSLPSAYANQPVPSCCKKVLEIGIYFEVK
jgi:hypothetical protein